MTLCTYTVVPRSSQRCSTSILIEGFTGVQLIVKQLPV